LGFLKKVSFSSAPLQGRLLALLTNTGKACIGQKLYLIMNIYKSWP
jgi:hypothetical protein